MAWHFQDTKTSFSKPQQLWRLLEVLPQYFQVNSGRSSGLQAHHHVGVDYPLWYPRASSEKPAALNSSSKARLSPGAFFSVNLTACKTWSAASLCTQTKGQEKETSRGAWVLPPASLRHIAPSSAETTPIRPWYWGALFGVQKANVFTTPKMRLLQWPFFREKWRSFTKKQYFCKCNGMAGFRGTRLLIEGL